MSEKYQTKSCFFFRLSAFFNEQENLFMTAVDWKRKPKEEALVKKYTRIQQWAKKFDNTKKAETMDNQASCMHREIRY